MSKEDVPFNWRKLSAGAAVALATVALGADILHEDTDDPAAIPLTPAVADVYLHPGYKIRPTDPSQATRDLARQMDSLKKEGFHCASANFGFRNIPVYTDVEGERMSVRFTYDDKKDELNSWIGLKNVPEGMKQSDDLFYGFYKNIRYDLPASFEFIDEPNIYEVRLEIPEAIPTPDYPTC